MPNIAQNSLQLFSKTTCKLGEGILWHPGRNSLFWLDILAQRLYEKKIDSDNENYDNVWKLAEIGSALALDGESNDFIFILTDKSFSRFSFESEKLEKILPLSLGSDMRGNDGSVGPDGSFWFGSMQKSPNGRNGAIYSISESGELNKRIDNIGIPNTFCWSKDKLQLFISDSYQQKVFSYKLGEIGDVNTSCRVIVDLSDTNATPDGGAIDENGNIWNAHWDGHKVQCYSPDGKELESITLPVPKVTNCCFGGDNNKDLFITSAKEGMSEEEIKKYPLSGCIFKVKLSIKGVACLAFKYGAVE